MAKRYFAVITSDKNALIAVMVAGYERDGKLITAKGKIGFAVDYYPDEKHQYQRHWGKAIIGDFATRDAAENAIKQRFDHQ